MAESLRRPGDDPEDLPEPPRIRALRRLVTGLTVTLIVGVVAIAATLVLRLASAAPEAPGFDPRAVSAERVTLPEGEAVTALGAAAGALLVATRDAEGAERLRVFDAATGEAVRTVEIARD